MIKLILAIAAAAAVLTTGPLLLRPKPKIQRWRKASTFS